MHEEVLQDAMIAEAKRLEEDHLYTSRGHFEAGVQWDRINQWLGIPGTVLAVVGTSLVVRFPTLAMIANGAAAVLMGLLTFLKPAERAAQHKKTGEGYLALRKRLALIYRVDLVDPNNCPSVREAFDQVLKDETMLSSISPILPRWAYERGKKGIKAGEAKYKVDLAKKTQE